MADFFNNQLDYIFFFYGLAFVLLVPVCQMLNRRPGPHPPWGWLALFGATHGVSEWLDLAALSWRNLPFDIFRLCIMALSFVFLLEFGRAGTVAARGRGPGRWVLAPLLFLIFLGGLAGGLPGLFASSRYALGGVGGLWAAGALFWAARGGARGKLALQGAALGLAVYAVAVSAGVPRAPFFPASVINYGSFLEVTGFPIQLVRSLVAVWISVCLWLLARAALAEDTESRIYGLERSLAFGAVTILILVITGGWVLTYILGNDAEKAIKTEARDFAQLIEHDIKDEQGEVNRLGEAMMRAPWLLPALLSGGPQTLQQAEAALESYSSVLGGSVCFLMDRKGIIIASSNRRRSDSLVGKSFEGRPFFQRAMKGVAGRYFEMTFPWKERGYFFSLPLVDPQGNVAGVAAIYRTLEKTESILSLSQFLVFFIDPHGIVFLSNRPEARLQSLWPLDPGSCQELMASGQFGEGPFSPILPREPAQGSECSWEGRRLLFLRQTITPDGWSLALLSSTRNIALYRLLGIGVTLLVCLTVIGGLSFTTLSLDATARLSASERRYRTLVEGSPNGVSLLDREGRYLAINQNGLALMGHREANILGKPFTEMWPEESRARVGEAIRAALAGEPTSFEEVYVHSDGRRLTWQVSLTPIVEDDGAINRLVGIAMDISERKEAEQALERSEKSLRHLTSQLMSAQETERQRIARELHDELGHSLVLLKMQISSINDRLRKDQATLRDDCGKSLIYLNSVIENTRRLSRALSPGPLKDLGLTAALEHLAEEFEKHYGLEQCDVDIQAMDGLFSPEAQVNLYRLVQESLTNIGKHALATRVKVAVKREGDRVTFLVEDNGKGFDMSQVLAKELAKRGLGLTAMEERVRMLGGTLQVSSRQGAGTRIAFSLPVLGEGGAG